MHPCRSIFGDPEGCSGYAPPAEHSWHQLGAVIDMTKAGLDDSWIVDALEDKGWFQSLPDSDPGRFSFNDRH